MKLYTIDTGLFKLDGGAMHGVVPKQMWNKHNPADENNMCTWAMRCLLVEEGNRLILIDTGMGNKQDEKFYSHFHPHGDATLMTSIQQLGFHASDITDVLLTHLHFDHCGGAIIREGEKLIPAFSRATYWSNENHWNWAINPNAREKASFLKENILPIQESGQLQFIKEGEQFIPFIDLMFVNGHTEAMMLPIIKHPQHTILYAADLIPSAAHISLPWVMGYDMRPLHTLEEKTKAFELAIANNWLLMFEHDHKNELASLVQTEKGVRMNELLQIKDLR